MKTIKQYPTQERLRELFDYREDGNLVWRVGRGGVKVGAIAGYENNRYWIVRVDGTKYLLHRLIWIWHHGDIPEGKVMDHIDGDRSNNRIENLQPLAQRDNSHRESTAKRELPRNVYKYRKGFRVRFYIDGRRRCFGTYSTVEEAAEVAETKRAAFGDVDSDN